MKILCVLLLIPFAAGCYWDNEETLYPSLSGCDTTSVSFSEDIVPMLKTHCYACHSNENAPAFSNGLALEDHGDVAAHTTSIAGAINHSTGYLSMPQGAGKLDPCLISKFEAWSEDGSPDN